MFKFKTNLLRQRLFFTDIAVCGRFSKPGHGRLTNTGRKTLEVMICFILSEAHYIVSFKLGQNVKSFSTLTLPSRSVEKENFSAESFYFVPYFIITVPLLWTSVCASLMCVTVCNPSCCCRNLFSIPSSVSMNPSNKTHWFTHVFRTVLLSSFIRGFQYFFIELIQQQTNQAKQGERTRHV